MSVVADRVKDLLDRRFVCYETIPHVTDYTAQESSEHLHTSGYEFAKAVVAFVDHRELVMAVVPAPHHVDLAVLGAYLNARSIKLAPEWRLRHHFPDCDPGAIPPFGNLYGMPVFLTPSLAEHDAIVLNAGSHEMAISLSYRDYELLVSPVLVPGLSRLWTGGESPDRDREIVP